MPIVKGVVHGTIFSLPFLFKTKIMNYIGALVAAWTATRTSMNMRRTNMKLERPNIFLICWLSFCFGFLITYLIYMILK
jgi:hypothetical protein